MSFFRLSLVAIGACLLIDGVGSIFYYWSATGPDGKTQGWRDHLIRVLRALAGMANIAIGVLLA